MPKPKLSSIPGAEITVKESISLKQSTSDKLACYKAFYEAATGQTVTKRDIVEQMLLDFMNEDKEFQKFVKVPAKIPQKPAAIDPSTSGQDV